MSRSYICKECNKPITHDYLCGQKLKLFLLKEGKVIETMEGEYNGKDAVLDPSFKGNYHPQFPESLEWQSHFDERGDLMFHNDKSNGMAAIHSECWKGVAPTERSDFDPDDGHGYKPFEFDDGPWEGDLDTFDAFN